MTPTPGLAITTHITLRHKLGEGGMGSVWAADHAALQTQVAVKVISAEHADDEEARARFMREAATAAQIKSPHVVQMFDRGFVGGTPYLVMELLHGESLRERIERAGPLSAHEVGAMLKQIGPALDLAHGQGIVHRDLKPENLFLSGAPEAPFVKILDFGIAKSEHGGIAVQTATFAVIGTPRYMSPEQLVDTKNTTKATDVWALGVLVYEALTGALPFDGDSVPALTLSVFGGQFSPATQRNPELPPSLDGWFSRSFQQEPNDRFGSMAEMVDAYHQALISSRASSIAMDQTVRALAPTSRAAEVPATRAVTAQTTSASSPGKRSRTGLWAGFVGAVLLAGTAGGAVLWTQTSATADTDRNEDDGRAERRRTKKPRKRKRHAKSTRSAQAPVAAPSASAATTSLTMPQMIADAVRRNGKHAMFSYIAFYTSGYAKIEMQDPAVRDRVQRHAYKANVFETRHPIKMSDADRRTFGDTLFSLKELRAEKLDAVAADALTRVKDPAAKVFGVYIDREYVSFSQARQAWINKHSYVVVTVAVNLPDRDVNVDYWGDGTFRCIPRDSDPNGDGCPEDP